MKKNTFFILLGLYFILGTGLAAAAIPLQSSDAEILGILSVMDQNEIQAAELAEQKTIDHHVMDYANRLDLNHNKHLDETRQLSQELGMVIEDNATLDELRSQGEEDISALTALDANDFAQLYIEDVIKEHSEFLDWINNQDTQNEQLKLFLDQTRKSIAAFLGKAKQIQEQQLNR